MTKKKDLRSRGTPKKPKRARGKKGRIFFLGIGVSVAVFAAILYAMKREGENKNDI